MEKVESLYDSAIMRKGDLSKIQEGSSPATTRNAKKERKQLKKKSHDLLPEKNDVFRITTGLSKQHENCVSFQFRKSNLYLRAKHGECIIERRRLTRTFEKECTFFPMVDLWFPGFVAFESTQKAAHYLRVRDGQMVIERYVATKEFKEEASFLLSKKDQ